MKFLNKAIIYIIEFYQKNISILFSPSCRFYPSCSQYAKLAFLKYNFFKALILSIYRVLRCNPFNKGGYDPLK